MIKLCVHPMLMVEPTTVSLFAFILNMYQTVTPPPNNRQLNITLVNTWRVVNAKGGTEKVFCDMANAFVQRGHNVTAICLDENQGQPGFPIDSRVHFINAYHAQIPLSLTKLVRKLRSLSLCKEQRRSKRAALSVEVATYKLRQALAKASTDVLVSFQVDTTYILKRIVGDSIPVVTMLHGYPAVYFPPNIPRGIKTATEASDIVQVLRPEFVDVLLDILPSATVEVIPNCVPQFPISANRSSNTIINVGRISSEKRQTLLIEAFALVKDKFPTWKLELWGETHYDTKYTVTVKSVIKKNGLEDCVRLCGATDNVPLQLKNASIFAFPSEFEGWGLALTEALSMGLPAIGCKECPAVNTLIRDGENGLLCDDTPESLAEALSKLMSDESLRIRFGNVAQKDMKAYAPERVWDQWENLLRSLTVSK